MPLTFISGNCASLRSLISTMQSTSSYAHMKLSVHFNVKCMAFIVCIIGPAKLAFSVKTVSLMYVLQLHFFSYTQSSYR